MSPHPPAAKAGRLGMGEGGLRRRVIVGQKPVYCLMGH
jgi:hypothetical protein